MADTRRDSAGRDRVRRPARGAAAPAPAVPPDGTTEPIVDVWSRSGTKYRTRAVVLFIVNLLLFVGLGLFAYWLRTGIVFAPAHEGYATAFAQTFRPSADTTITPSTLLTYPISIEEVPMQIVILGTLLAALVSIPILVSILYRFPACLPFLAVVAFVAMMPWLAITLAGSCVLASVRRFRFQFRYASALLGLVLVIIYFYGASRKVSPPVEVIENPTDRIKFIAPWILATVGSCVLMGFVLLIARMVNYRPGAIAPLLAVTFLIPTGLFEYYVGRDELHYRILEHDFGPGSDLFAGRNVAEEFEHTVQLDWMSRTDPKPPRDAIERTIEQLWLLQLENRSETARHVDWFCKHYPDSRYAVNALYLKGRALDMRVDQTAFRQHRMVRFYDDFPSQASRHTWLMVVENGPGTPMAAVALYRLAVLDIRAGDIDSAQTRLRNLLETFDQPTQRPQPTTPSIEKVLGRKPVEASLGVPRKRVILKARRLRSLLADNNDPLYGYEPVVRLFHLDPKDDRYRENLTSLLDQYPQAQISDNLELEIALATPNPTERIALMEACVQAHQQGDALPEALYRLGEAYSQADRPEDARTAYNRILTDHAESVWHSQAEERLRFLPSATTPTTAQR